MGQTDNVIRTVMALPAAPLYSVLQLRLVSEPAERRGCAGRKTRTACLYKKSVTKYKWKYVTVSSRQEVEGLYLTSGGGRGLAAGAVVYGCLNGGVTVDFGA